VKKDLIPAGAALRADLERDPEFRRTWDRTALARAVALAVVDYRVRHDLSQRKLAVLLDWKASQVARLELGEHNPTVETLIHLSQRLGLHFVLAIDPAGRRRATMRPSKGDVVHEGEADGSWLRVAVGA
jgi:ribosome-binding protein aMBF1 (putative translation factor)